LQSAAELRSPKSDAQIYCQLSHFS